MQQQAWKCWPANNCNVQPHYRERCPLPPPLLLFAPPQEAIFKGWLFLFVPVVADVLHHVLQPANSSVRDRLLWLMWVQLWKQLQCHLCPLPFHSSDLTGSQRPHPSPLKNRTYHEESWEQLLRNFLGENLGTLDFFFCRGKVGFL